MGVLIHCQSGNELTLGKIQYIDGYLDQSLDQRLEVNEFGLKRNIKKHELFVFV